MIPRSILLTLVAGVGLFGTPAETRKTFNTPQEARDALVQAVTTAHGAVRELFGLGATEVVSTGDEVQDKTILERFAKQVTEKTQVQVDPINRKRAILLIGEEAWPFAIPLVEKNGRWSFDVQEGKAEIRRRIIGANELDAIEICRGYVEAQQAYVETDWERTGVPQYAQKVISSEGKKDGLYWPGEDSPVGEGFAKAIAAGYTVPADKPSPYHGYFYKILFAQGPHASGGAKDYLVHGLMIGGFALVAWPAQYGVSGIMTFIVNQDGMVYEKDLGPKTETLAKAIAKFDPDSSWQVSP